MGRGALHTLLGYAEAPRLSEPLTVQLMLWGRPLPMGSRRRRQPGEGFGTRMSPGVVRVRGICGPVFKKPVCQSGTEPCEIKV